MSRVDQLKEGYEYCTCHPETCTHFDGVRWVGIKEKEDKKPNN